MNKAPKLEDLLKWAYSLRFYIEILAGGATEVQIMEDDEEYVFYADGDDLYEALKAAKTKFDNGE